MRNWKIQTKLIWIIVVFGLILSTYATISFRTREQLQVNGPFFNEIMRAQKLLNDVSPSPLNLSDVERVAQQLATETNKAQQEAFIRELRGLQQSYENSYAQWQKDLTDDSNQALKTALLVHARQPAMRFFSMMEGSFIPAVLSGDRARALGLLHGVMLDAYNEHQQGIAEAKHLAELQVSTKNREAQDLIASRWLIQRILWIGAILFSIPFGYLVHLSIARPLRATVSALATTSVQLATTIEEQERTAMNQSAAVNQTTAAMDELDASFSQTAEVVKSAAERVQQSVNVANEGIQTVGQMQTAMADLKVKVGTTVAGQMLTLSEQIAQISTITNQVGDLASQTNMLALNAAVEAARAGDQGRGFAVVAAEIRKLADASRKSADRINTLLEDIQRATNSAVMATEESAKTVDQVIRRAEATVSIFNEVKDASNTAADAAQQTLLSVPQQVTAVRQVLESMDALSVGSRETANAIGQSRIGSETLREAVARLKSTI